MHTGFWWEKAGKGLHLKEQGVEGRIILKLIFQKCNGGMVWLRIGRMADTCECGNEH